MMKPRILSVHHDTGNSIRLLSVIETSLTDDQIKDYFRYYNGPDCDLFHSIVIRLVTIENVDIGTYNFRQAMRSEWRKLNEEHKKTTLRLKELGEYI